MPQHKALLIGACEYDDRRIADLPFIRDDLQRMKEVLLGRGFQSAEIVESKRGITPNTVHGQVRRFLLEARPGDTLFILLSGHGQRFDGKDYLIPEDATFDVQPFAASCIEIGWQKELEESRADRVVFLIDACREGLSLDTKGSTGLQPWSRRKIADTLRRRVAYVYACSAGQLALFVRESDSALSGTDVVTQPGESFSLFSRAMSDVVSEAPHALPLQEFFQNTQQRLDELHRIYGKAGSPQQIKVVCESGTGEQHFPLLPGPALRTETHPWVRSTLKHPIWRRTPPGAATEAVQELSGVLAERLAASYVAATDALHDDPWHDVELAERIHTRLGFLTGLLSDKVQLSASEAALTVLLPVVEQTFWAQEAARRRGVLDPHRGAPGPDVDPFEKFVHRFPRLRRRLRTLAQVNVQNGAPERIRWWLFHRWLIQQPELYSAEYLKPLVGDVITAPGHPRWTSDALSAERLMQFLQAHRVAPFALPHDSTSHRSSALPEEHDVIAASSDDEQVVHGPLVAALTKAAYAMAIDPVDLPEIVVEHIGIYDSVDLDELLNTVRGSDWRTSGSGRSLNAVCRHPAVQIALREHAARVDALLRDINGAKNPALVPLTTLPPYADGGRVRLGGSTPEGLSDGIRFQLAEDRVQELLMGEELYGDRELAVRELYQNALDAVRYADCRTEFLRRTDRADVPFDGLIKFVQGVSEDGRPYLECQDNGIGMGITELSSVFSQGGARFIDLPEYIEEKAAWAELSDPRIELHPNSRFGIGVLSYFMLADEIVVRTCRMGRDGRPGRQLQVTIAGPGNLFRVEDLGLGQETGTTVRLLLSQQTKLISCVETLERLLWVAPYRTTAKHGAREYEWAPGELSQAALEQEFVGRTGGSDTPVFLASSDPDIWWVDHWGQVLSDGLHASPDDSLSEHPPYGIIVNLHGPDQPELSVDRKNIRAFSGRRVKERMIAAVTSLCAPGQPLPTPAWLGYVSESALAFADMVATHAERVRLPWQLGGTSLPYNAIGFFPPDVDLLPVVTGEYPESKRKHASSLLSMIPEPLLHWRLLSLYRAGLGRTPGVDLTLSEPEERDSLTARPSDLALLADHSGSFPAWNILAERWLRGPQAGDLYRGKPSQALIDTGVISVDILFPWWDLEQPCTFTDVMDRVDTTGLPAAEVGARLTTLGYQVEPLLGCAAAAPEDAPLLRPLGNLSGWLSPGSSLSAAQVSLSAILAGLPASRAAARLRELGFTVPRCPDRDTWSDEEHVVLKVLWQTCSTPPAPEDAADVPLAHLVAAAHATGYSLASIAELLDGLGFTVPVQSADQLTLTDDDRALLSYEEQCPFPDRIVPLQYVAAVAHRSKRSAPEVTARLGELGFEVPAVTADDVLPSWEEIALTGAGLQLKKDRPLYLNDIIRRRSGDSSLQQTASRLTSLGYTCAVAPEILAQLEDEDDADWRLHARLARLPSRGPVPSAALYAVADHIGRPWHPEGVAESLTALGFDVARPDEVELRLRLTQWELAQSFSPSEPTHFTGTPDDPPLPLAALVSTAASLCLPLHEVACRASDLGMRHAAENWFSRRPEGASAASAPRP
ncbi:HD domain-containing protein [Streptomyces sp. cg35]|uniref:HD domain-containing protein n=1 Tax=Streptomyces sp. cg35 TaxID=3421650 RepID=UPI003D178206